MRLFAVLLWSSAVIRRSIVANSRNSRFGGFNSRLGSKKFPFNLLRELARKALICPAVSSAKTAHAGQHRKNSRFNGKSREAPTLPPEHPPWRASVRGLPRLRGK